MKDGFKVQRIHMANPQSCKPESGDIHVEDAESLDKLDGLKNLNLLIIQRKPAVNYFNSKLSYDIMDSNKNVIFKARKPKSLIFSTKACKISVKNLRNVKLLNVMIEPTCDSNGTEANVLLYPKTTIAFVEKYGGAVGPPCFEIFNVNRKTVFTINNSLKKANSSSMLEYEVHTKTGTVANIIMKTGLNFILSTDPRMPPVEKAALLGVILAMDLLQTGSQERGAHKESSSNQYLFN